MSTLRLLYGYHAKGHHAPSILQGLSRLHHCTAITPVYLRLGYHATVPSPISGLSHLSYHAPPHTYIGSSHPPWLAVRSFFFFFAHFFLSSFWTSRDHRCYPFSPVVAFNFYRAYGSAIPVLVDCSSSVASSRSRAFRKSICPQEKAPTNLYVCALGGARTHETDLYTRLKDNRIRHWGDRLVYRSLAFTPPFSAT